MIRRIRQSVLFVLLWGTASAVPAIGQQHNELDQLQHQDVDQLTLFRDHGRQQLSDQGYTLKISTINDSWANVKGGNYRGVGNVGNLNLIFDIDTERAGWWENGQFLFFGIGVYGRRPSLAVGDYQYTSSIDSFDTFEPYELYYEHSFADGAIDVLAGIHDFTIDFGVLHYGMSFVNSSFFTPPTLTQLPYAFYPYTGQGTRLVTRTTDNYYVMAGIYDGKTTNPYRQRAHDWGVTGDDGAYTIIEAGWENSEKEHDYMKVAAGAWHNSGAFTDINDEKRDANYGTYFLAEKELWSENGFDDQGFGAFFQGAQAPDDRNFNPWYLGAALRYKGLLDCRDEDVIGFGYNLAQTSSRFRSLNPDYGNHEQVIEFSYRAVLTPAVTITPDVQYVFSPSARRTLRDSLIFYVRSEVNL